MGEPWDVYTTCGGCDRVLIDDEIDADGDCIYCGEFVGEEEED